MANILLKTLITTSGTYRKFRHKTLASGWVYPPNTTANYLDLTGLNSNIWYSWQSRVKCANGVWSAWSATESFEICTPATPTASEIDNSSNIYCNYAYGICTGYYGDTKEFQLKNRNTGHYKYYYTSAYYRLFPNLTPATDYRYKVRIKCSNTGSYGSWSPYRYFTTTTCLTDDTGIGSTAYRSETKPKPSRTRKIPLSNYPNPFNGQTTIEFDLENDASVTLFVSDITGKLIQVLLNKEQKPSGINRVTFDGSDHPAGIYYYTMQAGEHFITNKMILIK